MSEGEFRICGVTQPDVSNDTLKVVAISPPPTSGELTNISTIANLQATTLPVAPPEQRTMSGAAAQSFVFRLGSDAHVVSIKLDTRQIQERNRVRKIKEMLRRSTQG